MPKISNTIRAAGISLGIDPGFLQASLDELRRNSAIFATFPPGATLQVRYVARVPGNDDQQNRAIAPNSQAKPPNS